MFLPHAINKQTQSMQQQQSSPVGDIQHGPETSLQFALRTLPPQFRAAFEESHRIMADLGS